MLEHLRQTILEQSTWGNLVYCTIPLAAALRPDKHHPEAIVIALRDPIRASHPLPCECGAKCHPAVAGAMTKATRKET